MSDIHKDIHSLIKHIRSECDETIQLNKTDSVYTALACIDRIASLAANFNNTLFARQNELPANNPSPEPDKRPS